MLFSGGYARPGNDWKVYCCCATELRTIKTTNNDIAI